MLAQINQKLKEGGLQTASKFLYAYLESENEIVDKLNTFNGLQSEIFLHNTEGELDQLKFTSIFSDITSMYMVSPVKAKHHLTIFEKDSVYGYDRTITIPSNLSATIKPNYRMLPGYSYHTSADVKKVLRYVDPLLNQSKAVLRPTRTLWVDQPQLTANKESLIYYAEGNTPVDKWVIREGFGKTDITLESYLKPLKIQQLMELTIPYFRDQKLDRLIRILDEEQDTLARFRSELKKLIINFDAVESSLVELREDVLRPQIEQIERKFKHHKNVHSTTIAGSIAMFSLSLIKVVVPNLFISDFVNTVISGTSLSSILVSELKYQDSMNTLRDNPYFLLWRISKIQ